MLKTIDIVRGLRAAGLSQTEIARRTQINQSRLSRWEAGDTPAGADAALRLKALLDEVTAGSPPPHAHQEAGHAAA